MNDAAVPRNGQEHVFSDVARLLVGYSDVFEEWTLEYPGYVSIRCDGDGVWNASAQRTARGERTITGIGDHFRTERHRTRVWTAGFSQPAMMRG